MTTRGNPSPGQTTVVYPTPAEIANVAGVPAVGDVPTWVAPAGAPGHAAWGAGTPGPTGATGSTGATGPTGATGSGGSQPGAVIATKATFGFAAFTDIGGDIGRSPVAYTLAENEQLLFVGLRVTQAFDDGGAPTFYVSSVAAGPFGQIVGPIAPGVGPGLPTASDGIVGLFNKTSGGEWADQIVALVETETGTLAFHVFGSAMQFDGAAGIIEATFYTCTPVAA